MGDMVGHAIRAYDFRRNVADAKCGNLGAGVAKCHIMSIAGELPCVGCSAPHPTVAHKRQGG